MTDGAAELLFCLALPFISNPSERECRSAWRRLTTAWRILMSFWSEVEFRSLTAPPRSIRVFIYVGAACWASLTSSHPPAQGKQKTEAVKVVESPERTLWPQGQSYKLRPQGTELNWPVALPPNESMSNTPKTSMHRQAGLKVTIFLSPTPTRFDSLFFWVFFWLHMLRLMVRKSPVILQTHAWCRMTVGANVTLDW